VIKQYKAQYYQENKDRIKEKDDIKITCECGSICRKNGIPEYKRSIKHKKYIESIYQ
jgi:hypothetical protein